MKKREHVSMIIDKDLLEWIDKNPQFNGRSHGVRTCIQIAKRIYDEKNPEDIMKYCVGMKPDQ